MDLRQIAIVLSIAALPLGGCGGDRAKDVKPVVRDTPTKWQIGDVLTRESTETHSDRLRKVLPDGVKSVVRNSDRVTNAGWMEKCLEVDEDGVRARYLLYVREWLQKAGDTRDDSLQGRYVDVRGNGPAREWSLVGDDKQPSDAAKKWLEARFGPPRSDDEALARFLLDDEQIRPLILKDGPVAPGESWKPPLIPLADAAGKGGMVVDRARMEGTATLVGINDGKSHSVFEGSMSLTDTPEVAWTKGGVITLRIDAYYPPAGRLFLPSSVDQNVAVEGETSVQGATMELSAHFRERRRTTVGGDFPAPK